MLVHQLAHIANVIVPQNIPILFTVGGGSFTEHLENGIDSDSDTDTDTDADVDNYDGGDEDCNGQHRQEDDDQSELEFGVTVVINDRWAEGEEEGKFSPFYAQRLFPNEPHWRTYSEMEAVIEEMGIVKMSGMKSSTPYTYPAPKRKRR